MERANRQQDSWGGAQARGRDCGRGFLVWLLGRGEAGEELWRAPYSHTGWEHTDRATATGLKRPERVWKEPKWETGEAPSPPTPQKRHHNSCVDTAGTLENLRLREVEQLMPVPAAGL